jgi:hypothetical protein
VNIRCPKCSNIISVISSDFGNEEICGHCKVRFLLDIEHLAHFELPEIVKIRLIGTDKNPDLADIVITINYGYDLPPLKTNKDGVLVITKEMFKKAERDEISTGLMDHRGDYSLNRFIEVQLHTNQELSQQGDARKNSGWPILTFESELYGSLDNLINVYKKNQNDKINNASSYRIDLAELNKNVELLLEINA